MKTYNKPLTNHRALSTNFGSVLNAQVYKTQVKDEVVDMLLLDTLTGHKVSVNGYRKLNRGWYLTTESGQLIKIDRKNESRYTVLSIA